MEKFEWRVGGPYPQLEDHSQAKLNVLSDYIKSYLDIVCQSRKMSRYNITIIDGFAGGGVYTGDKEGSPLVMIRAVRDGQHKINELRNNEKSLPLEINPYYFFIEKEKNNYECLCNVLNERDIDKKIYTVMNDEFNNCYQKIIKKIQERHPRQGGGIIFFLDQCGYTDVAIPILQHISKELPNAEVIINISISNLIDFMGDDEKWNITLSNFGIEEKIIQEILADRRQGIENRYVIESKFSQGLQKAVGFSYFIPFFIEPEENHRGYWLLHLAQNYRAHNAMMDIIWEKQGNNFRHYGGAGLRLLALSYKGGRVDYSDFWGKTFNSEAQAWHMEGLKRDIPEYISRKKNGIMVEQFIKETCNETAANLDMYYQALSDMNGKDIKICNASGGKKRGSKLKLNDTIFPQGYLFKNLEGKK